jgi:hypothetical protein
MATLLAISLIFSAAWLLHFGIRPAIAFLIAPLATGVAIWLTLSALWLLDVRILFITAHEPYQFVVRDAILVSRLAIRLAGVVTLLGAVPAYWLFRRRRWLRLGHFVVLGIVLGWVPFGLATLLQPLGLGAWMPLYLLGIICGLASSTVFWLIGVGPGNDEPTPERSHRGAA